MISFVPYAVVLESCVTVCVVCNVCARVCGVRHGDGDRCSLALLVCGPYIYIKFTLTKIIVSLHFVVRAELREMRATRTACTSTVAISPSATMMIARKSHGARNVGGRGLRKLKCSAAARSGWLVQFEPLFLLRAEKSPLGALPPVRCLEAAAAHRR
jgi:hypothetical protein